MLETRLCGVRGRQPDPDPGAARLPMMEYPSLPMRCPDTSSSRRRSRRNRMAYGIGYEDGHVKAEKISVPFGIHVAGIGERLSYPLGYDDIGISVVGFVVPDPLDNDDLGTSVAGTIDLGSAGPLDKDDLDIPCGGHCRPRPLGQ